jgi:hypothetical protein
MLDLSVSYNRYKFLGYDFLTWLWYAIETDFEGTGGLIDPSARLSIGNRMALENFRTGAVERVVIRGDEAGLEEGRVALKKGAVVTELNLVLTFGEQTWRFSLKGESLSLAGVKPPETGPVDSDTEVEGAVLEKAYLVETVSRAVDRLYRRFIRLRVSPEWSAKTVPAVGGWIRAADAR